MAVTSPITLAAFLVMPYRSGMDSLQQDFFDLIVHGQNTVFVPLDEMSARQAAELRAYYGHYPYRCPPDCDGPESKLPGV
jgi:hypothetical protein